MYVDQPRKAIKKRRKEISIEIKDLIEMQSTGERILKKKSAKHLKIKMA